MLNPDDGGTQVAGPSCRPARYGLKTAAEVREEPVEAFGKGLEWDQLECGYDLGVTAGQCPPLPEQHVKSATRGFDTKYADPFAVYAGWECSAITALSVAWDNAEELLNRNF